MNPSRTTHTNPSPPVQADPSFAQLSAREQHLVKLALAIGGGLETEVHRQVRACRALGIEATALCHVAMLGVNTIELDPALDALRWIDEELTREA